MFCGEGNALDIVVRPQGYTQCGLVSNTESKHNFCLCTRKTRGAPLKCTFNRPSIQTGSFLNTKLTRNAFKLMPIDHRGAAFVSLGHFLNPSTLGLILTKDEWFT